jgi:hypothetical protein
MSLAEAEAATAKFLAEIGKPHERTMNDLINRRSTAVAPLLKHSTKLSYQWAFGRIVPALGGTPLTAIGKEDVQVFVTEAQKTLAPESVHDLRNRLSGLLALAEEWEWIERNPSRGKLRFPWLPASTVGGRPRRFLPLPAARRCRDTITATIRSRSS